MKKCMMLALVVCLLLAACGGEELIGEEKAIDIAFAKVGEYTTETIQKSSAVCRFVPDDGGYKVAFGGLIIIVDGYTGEVVGVRESA